MKGSYGDSATHFPLFDSIPFAQVSPILWLLKIFLLETQQICCLPVFSSSPKKTSPSVKFLRLPGCLRSLGTPAPPHHSRRPAPYSPGHGSSSSLPLPLRSSPFLPAVFHVNILCGYNVSIRFLNFSPYSTALFSKYYGAEAHYRLSF